MGRPSSEEGMGGVSATSEHEPLGEELVQTVERWVERVSYRLAPDAREPFRHVLSPPPDVRAALAWRPGRSGMSGGAANAVVTSGYHALDGAFAAYIGDPPVAAWITFAKYSSRQVGEWVRALEAWMTMASALGGGSVDRGLSAARDLWLSLGEPAVRDAAAHLLRAALRRSIPVADSLAAPRIVRDALVEANTMIFARIGVAFHAFLDAESRGEDGRLAIAALTRDGRLDDPMGHIARAFDRYRAAARLGALASGCARGDRGLLHALRRHLVADANWLIAVQEQALIQSPTIFDHPTIRAIFDHARPGQMRLPFDAFTLIPGGGNWADYATRMGLDEVAGEPALPDAFVVRFGQGSRSYVPAIDRTGTILDLFSRFVEGPAGERLRRGAPRSWRTPAQR